MDAKQRAVEEAGARIRGLLLGVAVGDALGVPVEFRPRGTFRIEGMRGHGPHAGSYTHLTLPTT